MAPNIPTSEDCSKADIRKADISKIHAEINQLVNQRFLLTLAALSFFGVVLAWLIPKSSPAAGDAIGHFVLATTTLLLVILFVLYLYSHFLTHILRMFSTYLLVTKQSVWEEHWDEYRQDEFWAYTKSQSFVFMILGGFAAAAPFFFAVVYDLRWEPLLWLFVLFGTFLMYEVLIYLMGFQDLGTTESNDAKRRWQKLIKQQSSEQRE